MICYLLSVTRPNNKRLRKNIIASSASSPGDREKRESRWGLLALVVPGLLFFSVLGSVWIWMFGTMLDVGQPSFPITSVNNIQGQEPSLIQCYDGSFMIAFKTSQGLSVTVSANGSEWSPVRMVIKGSISSHSLVQLRDGSVMLAFSSYEVVTESGIPRPVGHVDVSKSKDGVSWCQPVNIVTGPFAVYHISLLQLRNGS